MKSALERDVRLVRLEDGKLEIGLEASARKTLVGELSKKLSDWTGRRWMVVVSAEPGMPSLRDQAETRKAELKDGVRGDPLVQAVLARFPGAEIVDVRPPPGAPAATPDDAVLPLPTGRQRPRRRRAITSVKIDTGGAMADFLGLMKQATELKSKMEAMQAELERLEVEGAAGGGLVAVTLSGKGESEKRPRRRFALQAGPEGDPRRPRCRRARRCPPQARNHAGGQDAGAHRRPAAAARTETVLMAHEILPAPRTRRQLARPRDRRLIQLLARLPGLGPRSARRAALFLIKKRELLMAPLAAALQTAMEKIEVCRVCGNIDTQNPCTLCTDPRRDGSAIVVVADVADLWALERAHAINARYHVLGGTLSPLDGIGPDDLSIEALIKRAHDPAVAEVILALNATVDGQSTAHYITDLLHDANVKVTRLAHGVPVGGELDYLDEGTLAAAIRSRTPF